MKLFNTNSMDIIQNCQQYFDVELPSNLWSKHVDRFEKSLLRVAIVFLQYYSLCSLVCIVLLVKFSFFFLFLSATIYGE